MPDIEVDVVRAGNRYWVAAHSPAGDSSLLVEFPFDEPTLDRQLQTVELALLRSTAARVRLMTPEERPVQEFGRQLFEFLFPAQIREHLTACRQQDEPVRVRLRIDPPNLATLPWEFLYDPGRNEYLCLSTPLVRYPDVLEPRRPLAVTPPLRILGMVARPDDLDALNIEREQERLRAALAELERTDRVQLTWVAGQTWWDLERELDHGHWHIVHFIGHGGFDQQTGEGVLAFAGEDGGVHRLGASDLGLLLGEHRSLRLVMLNSCESARASVGEVFSSTAAALMRQGIPAVVAMQYEISDEAAITFARGFYTAIAGQQPVEQAVTRGRRAVKLTRRTTLEWATPVLYLRSPHGAIFDLADVPTPAGVLPAESIEPEPDHPSRPIEQADPALDRLVGNALAAFDAQRWEEAVDLLSSLVDRRPQHPELAAKLTEARRQQQLATHYAQGCAAAEAADWAAAVEHFTALTGLDLGYRDAAAKLAQAQTERELAQLRSELVGHAQVRRWDDVLAVWGRIQALRGRG